MKNFKDFREEKQEAECDHDWQEAVDDDGNLIEPPKDICNQCGDERY